jgi:hypothetical protein
MDQLDTEEQFTQMFGVNEEAEHKYPLPLAETVCLYRLVLFEEVVSFRPKRPLKLLLKIDTSRSKLTKKPTLFCQSNCTREVLTKDIM